VYSWCSLSVKRLHCSVAQQMEFLNEILPLFFFFFSDESCTGVVNLHNDQPACLVIGGRLTCNSSKPTIISSLPGCIFPGKPRKRQARVVTKLPDAFSKARFIWLLRHQNTKVFIDFIGSQGGAWEIYWGLFNEMAAAHKLIEPVALCFFVRFTFCLLQADQAHLIAE